MDIYNFNETFNTIIIKIDDTILMRHYPPSSLRLMGISIIHTHFKTISKTFSLIHTHRTNWRIGGL